MQTNGSMTHTKQQSELVAAVIDGDLAKVRSLVTAGASVTQADRFGWLPIHRAAVNNRDAIIQFLADRASPIDARGTDQWTALHLACVSGSSLAVAALLSLGADANSVARNDNTPMHLALSPLFPVESEAFHASSLTSVAHNVRLLLDMGGNPFAKDSRGQTPADLARAKGAVALAAFMESFP
jgi:ankyrin repeat protein